MAKNDEKVKNSYVSQAYEGILVDRTRSADPGEENEENEGNETEEQEIFATVNEALQFLADFTNSKVVITG